MKFLKDNIVAILFFILAVVVTLLLVTIFRKSVPNEKEIRNDEKVKSLERERIFKDSLFNVTIAVKDSQIAILSDKIINNKTSIIQSNERIKTLPSRISSMSIDDVLRTIEQ